MAKFQIVALIKAERDGSCMVEVEYAVNRPFPTLHQAEAYAFSLGATTIAAHKDMPGVLVASKPVVEAQNAANLPERTLVGRIGHGSKLHPVILSNGRPMLACTCPGTQQGSARITWYGEGTQTCHMR